MADGPKLSPRVPDDDEASVLSNFIEGMGLLTQAEGLPRIAGRFLALLVIEGGPLSFGEVADRLQVSRGSVSSNARLLETMGVLERVAKPGDRGDYFRLADDPYEQVLTVIEARMIRGERLSLQARDGLERYSGAVDPRVRRLHDLAEFYTRLRGAVQRLRTTEKQ